MYNMKYTLLFIPVLFSFIVNVNTWGVKLNDKDLFHSSKNNPKDTITLDTKSLSEKDTLTFSYHMCGYMGNEMNAFLIVKSKNNKTLLNYTNSSSSFIGAHLKIPADTIINLKTDQNLIKTSLCWQNQQSNKIDTLMTWTLRLK
jgi:hypothetical protein